MTTPLCVSPQFLHRYGHVTELASMLLAEAPPAGSGMDLATWRRSHESARGYALADAGFFDAIHTAASALPPAPAAPPAPSAPPADASTDDAEAADRHADALHRVARDAYDRRRADVERARKGGIVHE